MKYSDLIFDYLNSCNSEPGKDFDRAKDEKNDFSQDYYEIETLEQSKMYGKPIGKYYLLSTPEMLSLDDNDIQQCINIFVDMLKSLIGNINKKDRILVVGLGNRHISSDSLGAKVVGKVHITINNKILPKVMAIAPSVMGLTGIETVEIIEGVVEKTKPTHLILIDSLCASAVERLGRSIQLTNTGLCPGGGIGNNRKCIDNSVVKKIFSIGVPLMIFSGTFINSSFEKFGVNYEHVLSIMQSTRKDKENSRIFEFVKTIKKVLEDDENEMVVSIKDIEECVEILSSIIATAINITLGVE